MSDILIIGDKLEDIYIEVTPKKISAEAPILVYEQIDNIKTLPGGAGNLQALLDSLGHTTNLLFGTSIVRDNPDKPHLAKRLLPRKTRIMSGSTQLLRFDSDDHVLSPCAGCAMKKLDLDGMDAIVIADYQKGTISAQGEIALVATMLSKRNRPSPIYIHTKGDPTQWLTARLSPPPIMFVNKDEYLKHLEPYDHFELVVRTLGAAGAELVRFGEPFYWIPSFAEAILSVNGAGDAFMAGFIHEHLKSGHPQQSLAVGSIAAALTIARPYCGYIKGETELYEQLDRSKED